LVAYLVADDGGDPDSTELRAHLRTQLPEYMVPSAFVVLEELPLTPNGKVDRKALPAPERTRDEHAVSLVGPRSELEAKIAELWKSLLHVDEISVHDNFFDLGGHSLLSVQFVSRFEKAVGLRLNPANLVFQTLGQLAAVCEAQSEEPLSSSGGTAGVGAAAGAGSVGSLQLDDQETAAVGGVRISPPEVFYFGPSESALFGSYHPPQSATPMNRGVLLVYPMGQEYIRSHRAYLQLANRLARAGFPVMRFDFFGCGDSLGDHLEARVARWLDDIRTAIAELRQRSSTSRVDLVGLRLGGTLAALAAAGGTDVENLILWNPIVDGSEHREELNQLQREMLMHSYVDPKAIRDEPGITEIMGFPFASPLLEDLESIDLLANPPNADNRILLLDSVRDDRLNLYDSHAQSFGAQVEIRRFNGPCLWLEEPNKEVVPSEIWSATVDWMSRTTAQ
jgi:pimeloyl-ACP methyl ester carboxylesterase/acyl carrier protein